MRRKRTKLYWYTHFISSIVAYCYIDWVVYWKFWTLSKPISRFSSKGTLVSGIAALLLIVGTLLLYLCSREKRTPTLFERILRLPKVLAFFLFEIFMILSACLMIAKGVCAHDRLNNEFFAEWHPLSDWPSAEGPLDWDWADKEYQNRKGRGHIGTAKMGLTLWPHTCLGAVNPKEPGSLSVEIVDPKTEITMRAAYKECLADWSTNENEVFPFSIDCPFLCGRRIDRFVVRCELWFKPEKSGSKRKLMEKLVETNGYWY